MDADKKVEMSSLLEASESDDAVAMSNAVTPKESCNSFKTTDENNSADTGSNRSSATSLDQQTTLLSNIPFGKSKNVSKKSTSTTPTDDLKEVGSEDKLDDVSDGKESDTCLNPDEAAKEITTAEEQVIDNIPESAQLVDSAGSGESPAKRSNLNLPVETVQNVEGRTINVEKVIGDTFDQAHVDGGNKPSGEESVVKLVPCSDGEISTVVTILKPKAQSVDDDVVVDNKKTPSFFITNIVSGRIDLGDNAELIDDLIYWRDPKKTALLFTSVLSVLLAMQFYSVISVMAYVSLACLGCGFFGRLYSTSHATVNPILQFSPALSEENVRKFTDMTLYHVNDIILSMRRLYMADDLGDSIKFALVLWYLTYVGLWFNGMTIVLICFVTIFTVPNVYEYNKESIDDKMAACWEQWLTLTDTARTVSHDSLKRILSNERHEKVF